MILSKKIALLLTCTALSYAVAEFTPAQARQMIGFAGFKGLKIEKALTRMAHLIAPEDAQRPRLAVVRAQKPSKGFPYNGYEASWDTENTAAYRSSFDDPSVQWSQDDGLSLRMSDDVALTGGYEFRDSEDLGFKDYDLNYQGHEVKVGLKFKLP